jgi:hypothetical protein
MLDKLNLLVSHIVSQKRERFLEKLKTLTSYLAVETFNKLASFHLQIQSTRHVEPQISKEKSCKFFHYPWSSNSSKRQLIEAATHRSGNSSKRQLIKCPLEVPFIEKYLWSTIHQVRWGGKGTKWAKVGDMCWFVGDLFRWVATPKEHLMSCHPYVDSMSCRFDELPLHPIICHWETLP